MNPMKRPKNICIFAFWIIFVLALSILVISGCGKMVNKTGEGKKVALVLGGGGARGFAHVGVIRELESAGIPIDMIVGVSVGSLIGVMYADTMDSFKLEWKAFDIEKDQIFDFRMLNIASGLAKGEAIMEYIDKNIRAKNIEDLQIPVAIVAADLNTGEPVVFKSGSIRDAVRASVSVPGVFAPVPYKDKLLVDGGVLGNLAPQVAKQMGADIIIGVNISKPRQKMESPEPNAFTVIMESIEIMGDQIVNLQQKDFDFLIRPDVGDVGITDFTRKKELIEAGRAAAKAMIGQIREAVQ
jgi:NTE family protein